MPSFSAGSFAHVNDRQPVDGRRTCLRMLHAIDRSHRAFVIRRGSATSAASELSAWITSAMIRSVVRSRYERSVSLTWRNSGQSVSSTKRFEPSP
mgnify:CR=1 FL=1